MVIKTNELMKAVAIVADNNNMRITVKQSGKGALICGTSSLIGGMLAGPIGLAVGGTIGGIGAWLKTKDTFKSVGEVITNDLTNVQQERLRFHIEEVVQGLDMNDVVKFSLILTQSKSLQIEVLRIVASFIQNELHQQICS